MKQAKLWMIISAVMVVIGIIGGVTIVLQGEAAMGTTDRVPWGAMIGAYVFFVVSSTGLCLVSSLGHVFGIERFEVVGKRAVTFAIITLLAGFVVIGLELGSPLHLLYIILTPNFMSAIWWMGALYGLYIVLLFFELFFMLKNQHKLASLVGTLAFISAIAAHSNLGAVFGFLNARPYWTGPYMSIYFIMSAFLSGAAILSIIYYFVEKKGGTVTYRGEHIVPVLGKLLAMFLGMTMFFVTWKMITGLYGGVYGKYEAIMGVIAGPLAVNFWVLEVGFGMVIPFLILMLPGGFQVKRVFGAAVFTMIGIFFMRYDLVVAGQIVPLKVVDGLKETVYHVYHTALPAWAVIIGALGMAILLFLIAEQKLSLDYQPHTQQHGEDIDRSAAVKA